MPAWGYALLCLAAPALWSFVLSPVLAARDRRARDEAARAALPPTDYSI